MNTTQQAASAYLQACKLELKAFKPGNVSVYSDGHDMTVQDFVLSSQLSVAPLTDFRVGLGQRIYNAVDATRSQLGCNTNLGIILLAAPLLQALVLRKVSQTLSTSLRQVLESTSVEDADWCFQAIRKAAPGGLGTSDQYDVSKAPEVNLLEAMRTASGRDQIAAQYANYYLGVFDFSLPLLSRYRKPEARTAIEDVYIAILARWPDSHIARKFDTAAAEAVSDRAADLQKQLKKCTSYEQRTPLLRQTDEAFKQAGINPGTSADLTVATLMVHLINSHGTIPRVQGINTQANRSAQFHQSTINEGEKVCLSTKL